MKRFLILLLGVFAALALTAATATAKQPTYTLTLTATPSTLAVGETTLLSGALSAVPETTLVAGYDVAINVYGDETCSTEPYFLGTLPTADDGSYAGSLKIGAEGTFYFQASIDSGDAAGTVSACVPVTVTLGPSPEPALPTEAVASSYLCWNHEMVNPVAYTDTVADEMWTTGNYFEPQAILGNVVEGTNIGAYHLVCNAPSTMQPTGFGLGGSGEVYTPEEMLAYHLGHLGGNDLNVYHIYK